MEKTKKLFNNVIFIFRRDLRDIDNKALIFASQESKKIIPSFFFDERQILKKNNEYFSSNCVQFMIQSIIDLNNSLAKNNSKLFLFNGNLIKNLEKIITEVKIDAVYLNQDYTPFSIKRDKEILEFCISNNIVFKTYEDILLTNVNSVLLSNGNFFKKYTPYYNQANQIKVDSVNHEKINNFIKTNDSDLKKLTSIEYSNEFDLYRLFNIDFNSNLEIKGGRNNGLVIINNLKNYKNYKESREFPSTSSTRLSAYLKFGCISIREVFNTLKELFGKDHDLIRQLHWRDFYTKIAYHYPYVIGNSMKQNYDNIKWEAEEEHVKAWKEGKTGFPIVDAAMRCLNFTGYMHNRLRMIVSSFLVKDIICDWRIGEKYFANCLIDYDISLNNGGWQWSAGCGTDAMPYFRIFNPSLQSKKHDKDCKFILKWLPELKNVKHDHIHDWEKFHGLYKGKVTYPDPIFIHSNQKDKILKVFKLALYNDNLETPDKDLKEEDDDEEIKISNKISKNKTTSKKKAKDKYEDISSFVKMKRK